MAQEFTISISDALWTDVKNEMSTSIDPTLTGDITVERMTTYLNGLVSFTLTSQINSKKLETFRASLEE